MCLQLIMPRVFSIVPVYENYAQALDSENVSWADFRFYYTVIANT